MTYGADVMHALLDSAKEARLQDDANAKYEEAMSEQQKHSPTPTSDDDWVRGSILGWDLTNPSDRARVVARLNVHVDLVAALKAASHALRSYQYGNSATDLAETIANEADAVLAKARQA